jgi:outer membrane receptor protein involved in Fe transport
LFENLSIGGPLELDEGNTLGADARGDNTALNLRGIGSGNTLVLLNGRRMPAHPIGMAEGSVPALSTNVNNLPSAAMSRVEVLRDGASAVYGTDAAAGVVNTLTRSRFDGRMVRVRGSVSQHGGGNDRGVELTEGFASKNGRTTGVLTLDYYQRDFLWLSDRKFSRNQDVRVTRNLPAPFDGLPITDSAGVVSRNTNFDNRLSTDSSYFGGFVRGNYDAAGAFVGARPTGNRGIITTSGSTSATLATNGTFYLIPLVDGTIGWRQTLPSHNIDDYTVNWFQNGNEFKPILPKTDRLNLSAEFPPPTEGQSRVLWRRAGLPGPLGDGAVAHEFQCFDGSQHLHERRQSVQPVRHAVLPSDRGSECRRHAAVGRGSGAGSIPFRGRSDSARFQTAPNLRRLLRLPVCERPAGRVEPHLGVGVRGALWSQQDAR